ncbi:MAG: UDP-N-acetylmuramoyl-tripeptide--D-alanyl-D-alanine ligase [Planctomycetota bacterium]|nr:UDP-N-acetylmuramoyl-tripeptide--D-alanyl-D-alanine ligase [Planctomycetota bacterium]MDA1114441.1 UDP-N-acetylmuramoyl-tripeptide--D-alanyl-D-alanine ligase [Planctomycetota bacterium]
MLNLNTQEIAQVLGASLFAEEPQPVRRVVMDSRAVMPGDLFVALVGARTDGHAHLRQAFEKGAVAALVQPDRGERPAGLVCIVVPDSLKALGALARFHIERLRAQVVGITGSVGKTTAKDFLFQLLGGAAQHAFAAPASYNSEVGLPLAILGAPLDTKNLVLEFGINAPGEMDVLLGIARPWHVWITAIGASHLEGLGAVETVAFEKAKLAQAAPENGRIWIDEVVAEAMRQHCPTWQAHLDVRDHLMDDGVEVQSRVPGAWVLQHARYGLLQMKLHAEHEIASALTAARIARYFGVADRDLRTRLTQLVPPQGRMSVLQRNGVTVLDDAYNANPLSMHAALEVFREWPHAERRIAVLGSMKELGPSAEVLHKEVGHWVAEAGVDLLIGVGSGGAWIAEGVGDRVPCRVVDDASAAAAILNQTLKPGDVLLLKASRSEALERILPQLQATPSELEANS